MANKTDERLLDSFREASGGMWGRDETSGSAGTLKAELPAEAARETASATPEETRGTGTDALPGGVRQDSADAVLNAQLADPMPAAGSIAEAAQGQSASSLYGESGTSAGSSEHGSSSSGADSGSSTGSEAESAATDFLAGGGILSLIGGLIGLFGGGSSAPPALEKYEKPSPISFESADTGSGLSASDFDQMGAPRPYSSAGDAPAAADGGVASSSVGGAGGGTSGSGGNAAAPQISVTVQTMDAQSFLDNSDQIAQAVRGAMLNLSSINDVVGEL